MRPVPHSRKQARPAKPPDTSATPRENSGALQAKDPELEQPVESPTAAEVADESEPVVVQSDTVPLPFLERLVQRINAHYAFLLALPWLIFLVNPNWMFQGFGHWDAWYYFGMSINFPKYQHVLLIYPGERLTWIIPSRIFVALFSPVYGWMVFHLVLFWLATFSVYYLIRRFAGAPAALFTAAMMASHPMFIGANGWSNYDSGPITYLLLAFAALAVAGKAQVPGPYLILGGMLWAAAAYTNLFWWTLTPCCALIYWGVTGDNEFRTVEGRLDLRRSIAAAGYFTLGLAATTLLIASLFYAINGYTARDFYHSQLEMVRWGTALKRGEELSRDSSLKWVSTAGWLVFPILTFLACLFALVRHFISTRLSRFALATVVTYLFVFSWMSYFTFRATQLLRYDYYASILIPFEFLALGVLVYPFASKLSSRAMWWTVAAAVCISVAHMYRNSFYNPTSDKSVVWHYVAGAFVILAAMVARSRVIWIASAIGIGVVTIGLIPYFTSQWNQYGYNGIAGTRRIAEAIQVIDSAFPPHRVPVFWFDDYDEKEYPYTAEYRSIMCSYMNMSRCMRRYPQVDPAAKYPPGTQVIIITRKKDVFETANAAMTKAGMPLGLKSQRLIAGEGFAFEEKIEYWLTFVEVLPAQEPTASSQ